MAICAGASQISLDGRRKLEICVAPSRKRSGMENSMEREEKTCQVRRIGSVTFGITLLCYGVLFLVRIFVPDLEYQIIFQCWPVVFILLGIEILVENYRSRGQEQKFIYDFPAILMLGAMLFFAMIMSVIDYAMRCGSVIYW